MRDRIIHYFPWLTTKQVEKLLALEALYRDWNSKINVISRKDIDNFNLHHLLHSTSIARLIRFNPGTSIVDVGTGGGFPGIPLAIMFPESHFTLVDSIRKKSTVAEAVAAELSLKNVTILWNRIEEVNDKYDFIVSRAVTAFPEFYRWTGNMVNPVNNNSIRNGIIYLKGGDLTNELQEFAPRVTIYDISNYFTESFFSEKKIVYMPLTR